MCSDRDNAGAERRKVADFKKENLIAQIIYDELVGVRDFQAVTPLGGCLFHRGVSPELRFFDQTVCLVLKGKTVLNLPLNGIVGGQGSAVNSLIPQSLRHEQKA
jgi:hypothetical protein